MSRLTMLVLLGTLAGCMAQGTRVQEGQLLAFQIGQTSHIDVVTALGKPTTNTRHHDGTRTLIYTYTQMQARVENFIPVVAFFAQGATTETTTVELHFDAKDRLTAYSASEGATKIGTGVSSGAKQ